MARKPVLESLDRPYDPYQPRRLFKSARERENIELSDRIERERAEREERSKARALEEMDRREWEHRRKGLPW